MNVRKRLLFAYFSQSQKGLWGVLVLKNISALQKPRVPQQRGICMSW